MTLLFRCGHTADINPDKEASPRCACGEVVVARVIGAERPRFTGHATGPLVTTKDLGAVAVKLTDTPLTLKENS